MAGTIKPHPGSLSTQKEASECFKNWVKNGSAVPILSSLLRKPSARGGFPRRILPANPPLSALMPTLQYQPRPGDLRGITDPQSFSMWEKNVFSNQIFHKSVFKNNQGTNPPQNGRVVGRPWLFHGQHSDRILSLKREGRYRATWPIRRPPRAFVLAKGSSVRGGGAGQRLWHRLTLTVILTLWGPMCGSKMGKR